MITCVVDVSLEEEKRPQSALVVMVWELVASVKSMRTFQTPAASIETLPSVPSLMV